MTPKIEIFGQKFAHFGDFEEQFMTILAVEKDAFWTSSNFLWSYLGSIWALFSTLKGLLSVVFSTPKRDK